MHHITSLVGKTVTIRSIKGDEYIATLLGVDTDQNLLIVSQPRVVIVNNNEVVLFPFALTADSSTVTLFASEIFAVLESLPAAATEYQQVVSESAANPSQDSQ